VKKLLIALSITTLALNGCATNSKMENAGLGAVLCGLGGAGIGYLLDGGSGAAIGGGTGAVVCGLGMYFADAFSESVVEEEAAWKNNVDAKRTYIQETSAKIKGKKGKTARKINKEILSVSNTKMVSGRHLSPAARQLLSDSNSKLRKHQGNVHVKCPVGTPQNVMNEIRDTGVTCEKTNQLTAYKVVFSKSAGKRHRA
jgi:outer membrane lipoprotein SlyB